MTDHCVRARSTTAAFALATGTALTAGEGVTAHRVELRGETVMIDLLATLERAA